MTEPVSERTKQRRRILRAAAGAPIVLTLPSGAALAATSGVCDRNSLKILDSNPTSTFETSTDSWVRIELPKYSIKIMGEDDRVLGFKYGRDDLGLDAWYKVTDQNDAVLIEPESRDPDDENGPKIQPNEFYYGLVSYDGEGGGVLLLDQAGDDINPIAGGSCWSSLTGDSLTRNDNVIN